MHGMDLRNHHLFQPRQVHDCQQTLDTTGWMGNYSVLSLSVDNFSDLRFFINFGALWRGEGGIELSDPEGYVPRFATCGLTSIVHSRRGQD
jgi:hypothetical protein